MWSQNHKSAKPQITSTVMKFQSSRALATRYFFVEVLKMNNNLMERSGLDWFDG